MTAIRLVSTNASPKIGRARKRPPLISSAARRTEAKGERFYPRANLDPSDLPTAYLSLTSYRPRVERKVWRSPVAVVVGGLIWLLTLGASGNVLLACLFGALAALGVAVSDGWAR